MYIFETQGQSSRLLKIETEKRRGFYEERTKVVIIFNKVHIRSQRMDL